MATFPQNLAQLYKQPFWLECNRGPLVCKFQISIMASNSKFSNSKLSQKGMSLELYKGQYFGKLQKWQWPKSLQNYKISHQGFNCKNISRVSNITTLINIYLQLQKTFSKTTTITTMASMAKMTYICLQMYKNVASIPRMAQRLRKQKNQPLYLYIWQRFKNTLPSFTI